MSEWLSRRELAKVPGVDRVPDGVESLVDILGREPELLLAVEGPATPPLDLATYRVRYERWRDGVGPALKGIDGFMSALEGRDEPTCAVSVNGEVTNYVLLLNADRTEILAGVAVDPPATKESTSSA